MLSSIPSWATLQPAGVERHLPVYLLLDVSGSMAGAPIEAVRRGLEQFQREVCDDPFAREVVRMAVITFASDAKLVTDGLIPITSFRAPELRASGVTRLDLAFRELARSLDRHVVRPLKGAQRGDWKPAVFVLTDGCPTDGGGYLSDSLWNPARGEVVNRPMGQIKPSAVVAVGCGRDVDDATLRAISTGTAFRMGIDPGAFASLFQYLSRSITRSVQPGRHPEDAFADLQSAADCGLVRIL